MNQDEKQMKKKIEESDNAGQTQEVRRGRKDVAVIIFTSLIFARFYIAFEQPILFLYFAG